MKKIQKNAIIEQRLSTINSLLTTVQGVVHLEREVALLMLDVLAAIETKMLSPKEASKAFVLVSSKTDLDIKQKVSEDFSALTAEGMLLDEIGKKYAPNLAELRELATRILSRDKKLVNYSVPSRMFAQSLT